MSRRIITFIFILGLIATFLLKPQLKSQKVLGMPNFTVITRTSTPKPATATPKGSDGGSNPAPQATQTAVPIVNTATPTLIPVTLVATPVGGFLPTAVACGFPPTVQAQNNTRVRLGPDTDFEILGQLVYLETRPIVGRAADTEWWVIQFTNNQIGWVSDAVVNVHGNTSGVPIVSIEENVTANPLWNPTPNPECPVLPSATPTATETATIVSEAEPTMTETPLPTETATSESSAVEIAEISDTATPVSEESTPTATSVVPTAETIVVDIETESLQPTAEPLDAEESPSAVNALPCASAMIGLAVIGFLTFRRIF